MKNLNLTSDDAEWLTGTKGNRAWDVRNMTDSFLITVRDIKGGAGYHARTFLENHIVAKDSGGFDLLMNPDKAANYDVQELIERHKTIGVQENDIRMTLDFPVPRLVEISNAAVKERQTFTTRCWNEMEEQLPGTVPIVHGRNALEIQGHYDDYEVDDRLMAVGSNLAQGSVSQMKRIGHDKNKGGPKEDVISKSKLYDELFQIGTVMREKGNEWFLLGAGSMTASALAWMMGANKVDGTTWRICAMQFQILCPEIGRTVAVGEQNNQLDRPGVMAYLKELYNGDEWPLCKDRTNLPFNEVMRRISAPTKKGEDQGIAYRAAHNIWALDRDATQAEAFECDPDGYAEMLKRRWSTYPIGRKLVDKCLASVKDSSIQSTLTNYTKA